VFETEVVVEPVVGKLPRKMGVFEVVVVRFVEVYEKAGAKLFTEDPELPKLWLDDVPPEFIVVKLGEKNVEPVVDCVLVDETV
jgi:hypothetical protein